MFIRVVESARFYIFYARSHSLPFTMFRFCWLPTKTPAHICFTSFPYLHPPRLNRRNRKKKLGIRILFRGDDESIYFAFVRERPSAAVGKVYEQGCGDDKNEFWIKWF